MFEAGNTSGYERIDQEQLLRMLNAAIRRVDLGLGTSQGRGYLQAQAREAALMARELQRREEQMRLAFMEPPTRIH